MVVVFVLWFLLFLPVFGFLGVFWGTSTFYVRVESVGFIPREKNKLNTNV